MRLQRNKKEACQIDLIKQHCHVDSALFDLQTSVTESVTSFSYLLC